MKIAFISLIEDVSIPGLRYLSAYLRAKGQETTLILLPQELTDSALNATNSFLYPYSTKILEQLAEICKASDLIGISMMSCHFDNAIHVTRFLQKRLNAPIIWGGIHPTIRPNECLDYADMVCIGEGEISLGQLASEMSSGKSWESLSIPGIYNRYNGQISSVIPSPIISKIDDLPLPDYDLAYQYILYRGNIIGLNRELLVKCLGYSYRTLFSRGCPYACTYCCNNALSKIYGHKLAVRWRNLDNQIRELKAAVDLMPELRDINLADDAFLAQPFDFVKKFADRYHADIHLPLAFITTPLSLSKSKLTLLSEAGLYYVGIGLQSGSERILKGIYSRPESVEDLLSACSCISEVAHNSGKPITGRYDIILDNPWETEQDKEASIRLCMQLKRPYVLAQFSLTFYPETELYFKARNEGIIHDDLNQVYRHSQLTPEHTYLNGVFTTLSAYVPERIVAFLLRKSIRRLNPVWLPYFVTFLFNLVKLCIGVKGYIFRRDWRSLLIILRQELSKITLQGKNNKVQKGRVRFCGAPGEVSVDKT